LRPAFYHARQRSYRRAFFLLAALDFWLGSGTIFLRIHQALASK